MKEIMKKYQRIELSTSPFPLDLLSGLMWDFNPDGIEEEEEKLIIYSSHGKEIEVKEIEQLLIKLKDSGLINSFEYKSELLPTKNWNREWEQSLNIIKVTENITIKPTFRDYEPKPDEIVILIDPKMSFGTGEHQTTKMIIRLLEKYVRKGMSVLDAGTGTGILAITAVKLGADIAIGFDNDELCLINGLENVELNSLQDKVEIRLAEISDIDLFDFDLVIANIQKNVLNNIAESLHQRLKTDGLLMLSGLLTSDEEDIYMKYQSLGFGFVEKLKMDEWIGLVYKKL